MVVSTVVSYARLARKVPHPAYPTTFVPSSATSRRCPGPGGWALAPASGFLRRPRLDVEGDGGVRHVVVVDPRQAREVARLGRTNPGVGHGDSCLVVAVRQGEQSGARLHADQRPEREHA